MECAKIPLLILVLGFWGTLGNGLKWERERWVRKGGKLVPPLGFFYLSVLIPQRDPAPSQRNRPPLPPVQKSAPKECPALIAERTPGSI